VQYSMVVTSFDSALLRDAVSGSSRRASCSLRFTHSRAAVTFASCRTSRKRSRRSQIAVRPPVTCSSASAQLQSETELFLDSLEKETASELPSESNLTVQLPKLETQVSSASFMPASLYRVVITDRHACCSQWSCRSVSITCIRLLLRMLRAM
jgi:hypothetical protein